MSGELILASSSEVRKALLEKSNILFSPVKPNIDDVVGIKKNVDQILSTF